MEKKMNQHRANGEGTIYYNEKRREYIGSIRNGTKPDGTPNRVVFHSGKNGRKSDVAEQMIKWRMANQADYLANNDIELETGMTLWLEKIKRPELKPASYDRLESIIRCQIAPRIGDALISELTDVYIQTYLLDPIINEDKLSYSSAKKVFNALNAFLKYAVYKKMISNNPMYYMKAPKDNGSCDVNDIDFNTDEEELIALTMEEMQMLRSVLYTRWKSGEQKRRYAMGGGMDLILNTGMRMGEALALRWTDVDWNKKTISITKNIITVKNRTNTGTAYKLILQDTPKTNKSRRVIPLNKAAINALNDLKEQPGYNPRGFIIHTAEGKAFGPRNYEQQLGNMCKAAGIRKIGVHALRHTYATRLFEKGVDVKIISELLGHSTTEITYRIYIHVIEQLKENAVQALEID